MKVHSFHLMPYPFLPDDFRERYHSVYIDIPPDLYDPELGHGVYNDYRDEVGFSEECEHGRTLGMDGKTLIHPSQVAPCNQIFSPTEEEVSWARKIIAAFEDPANAHKGVITLEGRMVERLHLVMARRTVAIADAIEAMKRTQDEWF